MDDYCTACGMACRVGDYHPYAACLMKKGGATDEEVKDNLTAVLKAHADPLREMVAEKDRLIAELVEALETVPRPYWDTYRLAAERDWESKRDELLERCGK